MNSPTTARISYKSSLYNLFAAPKAGHGAVAVPAAERQRARRPAVAVQLQPGAPAGDRAQHARAVVVLVVRPHAVVPAQRQAAAAAAGQAQADGGGGRRRVLRVAVVAQAPHAARRPRVPTQQVARPRQDGQGPRRGTGLGARLQQLQGLRRGGGAAACMCRGRLRQRCSRLRRGQREG